MVLHDMTKNYRKDATITICKDVKASLLSYLTPDIKIGKWVEKAIAEKRERETNGDGNVILERHLNQQV